MKNGKNKILTSAILVLILWFPAAAEDAFLPRLDFTPGDSYTSRMEMNRNISQTIAGDEQMMEQNLVMVWDYNVNSRDDSGDYHITARPVRIQSKQKFGMQTIEFDSDNPGGYVDPSMAGFKAMIGAELKMTVEPNGKVADLEGFEGIIDKVIDDLDIPDSPQKDQIVKNLQSQFGDEAMRNSFEQITSFYPDKPVRTGDSWHNKLTLDVGFPMVIESDYTLVSSDSGIAEINAVSDIKSNPGSEGIDMGEFTLVYDIKGDQSGRIKMDEKSGLPLRSEMNQRFSGNVSISDAPDLEDKSWPISAEGNMIVTFSKQ